MKKTILTFTTLTAFIGCGGGIGSSVLSLENDTSSGSKNDTTNTSISTKQKITLKGKWEEKIDIEYLHSTTYNSQTIRRHIYKQYDGEYGKGIWGTSCAYHPNSADWDKVVTYNGIDCPADYYIFPKSRKLTSMDEQQLHYKNGDFAVIGNLNIDRAYFVDGFDSEYYEFEAVNITTPEITDEIIKTHPSSDNRSLVCNIQEEASHPKTKSEISNIKLYHHHTKIKNGAILEQKYYPNCISKQHHYMYTKYQKAEIISSREFKTEVQFGKDDDKDAYISKSHWKKID